jgi:hypothetical protein
VVCDRSCLISLSYRDYFHRLPQEVNLYRKRTLFLSVARYRCALPSGLRTSVLSPAGSAMRCRGMMVTAAAGAHSAAGAPAEPVTTRRRLRQRGDEPGDQAGRSAEPGRSAEGVAQE